MSNKSNFMAGVQHSYPVCLAFTFMFAALGMLGHAQGFSLFKMLIMSATIFAVPLQALVINKHDLPLYLLAINAFILNFKFLLMSSVLLPLWHKRAMTIPSLHFICSSTYMVCSIEKEAKDPWMFYLGVAIPSYFAAVLATGGGYVLWDIGSNYHSFLHNLAHIVLPVHFICLTMKRKKEKIVIVATCAGIIATPILSHFLNAQLMVIMWIIIAGLFVLTEDLVCGKQSLQRA